MYCGINPLVYKCEDIGYWREMDQLNDSIHLALALECAELEKESQRRFDDQIERKLSRADFFNTEGKIVLSTVAGALQKHKDGHRFSDVIEALDNHYEEKDYIARDKKIKQEADTHANKGGDTTKPKICTISFPGKIRGELFRAINSAKLNVGRNGDVHAMNDLRFNLVGSDDRVKMPRSMVSLLSKTKHWTTMVKYLQSREASSSFEYKDGKCGPKWFVKEWAKAALYTAKKSSVKGCGIIVYANWEGFLESKWCKLEFLFCKCLVELFPNSVYLFQGSSDTVGHFMRPDDDIEFNLQD